MTRHVALLRAVNVGGRGTIAMADLKAVAESTGLIDVTTLLASGTFVFSSAGEGGAIETALEKALAASRGRGAAEMVRSVSQWRALIAANPFAGLPTEFDAARCLLLVLKGKAATGAETALRDAITGREQVVVSGDAAFVTYPNGIGRSKLTSAVLRRHLGTPSTGRNWTTVRRIAARLGV